MENLNEGKKKKGGMAYEAALREIDAQSAVVALEAKIEKLKEMAETKAQRLEMVSEDENLSELYLYTTLESRIDLGPFSTGQ